MGEKWLKIFLDKLFPNQLGWSIKCYCLARSSSEKALRIGHLGAKEVGFPKVIADCLIC